MCGIVGYVGKKQAAPILLDGLAKLEYRGYDSAGLAVRDGDALAEVVKEKGKLKELSDLHDNDMHELKTQEDDKVGSVQAIYTGCLNELDALKKKKDDILSTLEKTKEENQKSYEAAQSSFEAERNRLLKEKVCLDQILILNKEERNGRRKGK